MGSLAAFLIARSCGNACIATALFWHLSVERSCGGQHSLMYKRVHLLLCQRLHSGRVPWDLGMQPRTGGGQDAGGAAGPAQQGGVSTGGTKEGDGRSGGAEPDSSDSSSPQCDNVDGQGAGSRHGKPLLIDVLRRQEHFVAALGGLVAGWIKAGRARACVCMKPFLTGVCLHRVPAACAITYGRVLKP